MERLLAVMLAAHLVLAFEPAALPIFYISTVVGNGSSSTQIFPANDSPATAVSFPMPQSAVDENGDLIVVTLTLDAVFRVRMSNGTLQAVAGTGQPGSSGRSYFIWVSLDA